MRDRTHPYRSLSETLIAVKQGCDQITSSDLEVVLGRGRVAMTGTRSDTPPVADRIEQAVAEGFERIFNFPANTIWIRYATEEERGFVLTWADIFSPAPVTFERVMVHWEQLLSALSEAQFQIHTDDKEQGSPDSEDDLSVKQEHFSTWMKSQKNEHGRYPPRDPNPKRPNVLSISVWARDNHVPVQTAEEWAIHGCFTERKGRPKSRPKGT